MHDVNGEELPPGRDTKRAIGALAGCAQLSSAGAPCLRGDRAHARPLPAPGGSPVRRASAEAERQEETIGGWIRRLVERLFCLGAIGHTSLATAARAL
eukprot:scaffold806_cov229-Pinguiococcus_pyrenoidosus.AAC.5